MRTPSLILAGVLCGVSPLRVQADPITITAIGTSERYCCMGLAGFNVAPGAPFTLSLSFDSVALDEDADSSRGIYRFGTGNLSFSVGTATLTRPVEVDGFVSNDNRESSDSLQLVAGWRVLGFPESAGFSFGGAGLLPNDNDWLDTDAWPIDLVSALNGAPHRFLSFGYLDDVSHLTVGGSDLRFAQAPVPEPATLILLGTGLLGVTARRWRQQRQH